jgi:hypothetical protein
MDTEPNDSTFVRTFEGAGSCPHCRYVLPRLVDCAPTYFEEGHITCTHCGKEVDLWQAALERATRLSQVAHWALESPGAVKTSVVMQMESGKYYEIQLTDHGAPPDAKILGLNCTSQGGENGSVIPLEWKGNNRSPHFVGTVLKMVAVPLGEGPVQRVGRVAISVVWIRGEDSDAWPYLATAFEAASASEFAPAMVFAQSAVEISLMPLIKERLTRYASAECVERFMSGGLTYGYALNIVLPYMCAELSKPQMPANIRGALNKLRVKRNHIIHEGSIAAAISPEDAMEGLCAASFGFEFMRYVGPSLLKEGK